MQAPPAQFATKTGANTGSSNVRYFKKLLFRVGVGLDVGPVYENCLGGQISRFRHLFQYPRKDLVHGFCGKPMTEIITHRGKMRRFLLQRISQTQRQQIFALISSAVLRKDGTPYRC